MKSSLDTSSAIIPGNTVFSNMSQQQDHTQAGSAYPRSDWGETSPWMFLIRLPKWMRPLSWTALALGGQIAALMVIRAGPVMGYQHYIPLLEMPAKVHPVWLMVLVLQVVAVVWGVLAHGRAIWGWLKQEFRLWQVLVLVVIVAIPAATVSPSIQTYLSELSIAAVLQFVNLANVILLLWSLPGSSVSRAASRFEAALVCPTDRGADRWALGAALTVFVAAATLALFIYERHPHIPDEAAYIVQARTFAAGTLALPAPPVPEAFEFYLMQLQPDRWFATPPPGWPLALAAGVRFGLGWLVNPILAGLNVILAFAVVRRLYDLRTARLTALLMMVSPWMVFMGMNWMTHTWSLTCALAAALSVMRTRETGQARYAAIAGVSIGWLALTRPLESVILGGLLGLWSLGLGGERLSWKSIGVMAVFGALVGGLMLPYNLALTGDPMTLPIMTYTDQIFGEGANAYGFGPDRGMGWPFDPNPGHSLADGLINANLNMFSLNTELFGWRTGSLIFAALFLIGAKWGREDRLMLAAALGVVLAHFPYYFSGGPDFGARYWFLMSVPLVVLTVRGLDVLRNRLPGSYRDRAMLGAAVLSIMAVITFFPWRAVDKYHQYLNMRPDVRHLSETNNFGRSLVLVRGSSNPDYVSAAVYNPLDLTSDKPIYAWDRSPEIRMELLEAYSDRPIWILDGPTITGTGYQVAAGPISASEAMAELNDSGLQ